MFESIFKNFIRISSACTIRSFDPSLASNLKDHVKFVSLINRPCPASQTLASATM